MKKSLVPILFVLSLLIVNCGGIGQNPGPRVYDQTVSVDEDHSISITVEAFHPSNAPLTWDVAIFPNNGSIAGTLPKVTYSPDANFNGVDSFSFRVDDGQITSDVGKVTINVRPVNDAPTSTSLDIVTYEDTNIGAVPTVVDVDLDYNGDTFTFAILTQPSIGVVSIDEDQLFFEPYSGMNGTDSFNYRVFDSSNEQVDGKANITVKPVNDPPVANDQTVTADEDVDLPITLTASDPDGDPLNYSIVFPPGNGTLTGTPPNVTYLSALNYNGDDSFTFRVNDGLEDSYDATVYITVDPVNDAPISTNAAIRTDEDTPSEPVTPTVLDVDLGDTFTFTIRSQPASGTASVNSYNELVYTPDPGFNGSDPFTYRATDSGGLFVDGTANVTVGAVNDTPVADDQTVTADEDVGLPITLTGSDPDGDPLNYTIVFPPAHGILTGSAPNVTYLSDLNYNGPDNFTFQVDDGLEDSNVAYVDITVNPVNDAPTSTSAFISTDEDTISEGVTPTVVDVDDGDTFTFSIRSQPASGTASIVSNQLVYNPNPGFNGSDPFNYRATDSGGLFVDGTANVTVGAVNDAPVADSQSVVGDEDVNLNITLTGSDPDVGDTLTFSLVDWPDQGEITGTPPNVTYVPGLNYNGTDNFSFRVDDGIDYSNVAVVNITINPVNDAPTGTSALISTDEDTTSAGVTPTVQDVDIGETFTFSIRSQPASGTASIVSNQLVYTPDPGYNGNDQFDYRATDSGGLFVEGTASVTVGAVNDAPVADDQTVTTDEDVDLPITLTASDPDGDSLFWAIVTFPAHGRLLGTLPNVTYRSDPNYNGPDSFAFQVNDGIALSNVATVDVTIDPVNDPPTGIVAITGSFIQGATLTAGNNLADNDGLGTISYQWRSNGANVGTGSVTFNLTQAAVGTTISVVASYTDGEGTAESVASDASPPVANVNDEPTGTVTITGTAREDQTLTASNNLADIDGLGTISYQWRSNGANVGTGGVTFNLTQAAVGTTISVVASYIDGEGTPESVASAATAPVANVNDDPTGTVTITGTPTEGQTLTASNNLADEDGLGTINYQWRSGGANTGAASPTTTFVLTQAAVGKTVSVVAIYTDGQGTLESVASAETAAVANVNDPPTGTVTITGTPTEGEILTASNNLADEDGLGTINYQWRSGGANTGAASPTTTFALTQAAVGTTISVVAIYTDGQGTVESVASAATAPVANVNNAPTGTVTITGTPAEGEILTASNNLADEDGLGTINYQWRSGGANTGAASPTTTFALTQAAVGTTISVVASYTDGGGTLESVASAATAPVANVNNAPTGTVTISGTPTEDETLTASNNLADVDGLGTISYQWRSNGANVGTGGVTFNLTQAAVGTTISVVASYTDGGGTLESVASAATAPVANLNDDPTGTVTITGTPTEDETLTASNNLADEDGLGTISYQWRSNGANVGTGGVTFNLTQAAVGTTISVVASYTDGQGTPESVASAATAIVANVNDDPTGTVTITGTPTEGEVLSADTSTLADEDGLGTLGYQWQAGGVDIASANAIDYMLTAAEIGSNITVVVSYTDGQGTPESVTSAAVGPVTAAVETLALELTPGILFVDIDATGIADGSSWADAYNHPQDALDKAQPGDEIWVAEGVYAQRAAPDSYVITMVDGVDLYGGFSGVEAILSERDINAHLTVLDGEDSVDGVYGAQDARLDGIAVTRAMSSGMRNDSVSPTVMNCIFEDNGFMGGVSGGAIQNISGANAYISDSTFVNNSGSAIFNENSSPMINNSSFYNNYGDSGGAIQNQGINSQPVITNCLFDGNTAAQLGGAVYNSEGEPTLINSTIVENTAGVDGGGVASESGQGRGPTIINSILWNNSGLEIFDDLSSMTSAFYSNIEGGYSGTGNIDLDPSFVDAAAGDYSLAPGSPCIDAGDNASVSTSFDLNGDPRITNGTVDMGAYEYTP